MTVTARISSRVIQQPAESLPAPQPTGAADASDEFEVPCQQDPEMWFAEAPAQLQIAKTLCAACPIRLSCLAAAIHGAEYAGVWGGHIIERGRIVPSKRGRGRPSLTGHRLLSPEPPPVPELDMISDVKATAAGHTQLRDAARQLYDAECALYAAHRSGVDAWVAAANDKLHEAVTNYVTAMEAEQQR